MGKTGIKVRKPHFKAETLGFLKTKKLSLTHLLYIIIFIKSIKKSDSVYFIPCLQRNIVLLYLTLTSDRQPRGSPGQKP